MRNKGTVVLVVTISLLVVWWGVFRKPDKMLRSPEMISHPQIKTENKTSSYVSQATPMPRPTFLASYETMVERMHSDFRTPISFYGKVIDQHGDAVSNADVSIAANNNVGREPTEYTRKTDATGMFSITGIGGLTLAVRVSRAGYRGIPPIYGKVTSSGLFEYGLSSRGTHQSSKDSPTIFTLHRIGAVEPLIRMGEKNFRMARDGMPLSIAVDEQGAHQVVLRCWNQELSRPTGQQQYDWKLEITVPNGGLVARKDAFAFEAPQDGYAPTDVIEMPASLPYERWDSFAERSYFIRFGDGTFARTNLRMRAGGDHFVVWESFFNPKVGSRNLESSAESASR